ncbi:rhodanese-like domain-containing protein [Candidatus Aminicenantes bacterium AC-335-A11]|nr:rhodanese-like domain-containing protein [SCandidatus Aminicenantes bacterium Aminicenantia_JdfR_composite]MCP2597972.1 rhodanese-like domain-containing protein [Candidatus Aminicenantes bacterium AC-335-L06]MCP2618176.1 rhodanese-like domain-containing protein [Candidatus Aminicenantes bacterium AC-335-A11]
MRKSNLFFIILLSIFSFSIAQDIEEILPDEAYKMLKNPRTYLVDVRSIAEYVFIGHPEKAYNIPLMFWSEEKQKLIPNKNFIQDLKARFTKTDTLIFICRSGKRSLKAASIARKAGFLNVFSIKEGFEGEKDEQGHRTINGWKNRNLPYTYSLKKEFIYSKKE